MPRGRKFKLLRCNVTLKLNHFENYEIKKHVEWKKVEDFFTTIQHLTTFLFLFIYFFHLALVVGIVEKLCL